MIYENKYNNVIAQLPFNGRWFVSSTPAHKIPSHGTDMFGVGYALDFIAVDSNGRTSKGVSLFSLFGSEKPENFHAFGKPVLSPISGEIIATHNGEEDHRAYRNLFTLIPYMLGQKKRIENGVTSIAGNHIIIKDDVSGYYIAIVHLKLDSIRVTKDNRVLLGEHIADCGNSGNSTQPCIHIQAMTSIDFFITKGVPIYFENYTQEEKNKPELILNRPSFPKKDAL